MSQPTLPMARLRRWLPENTPSTFSRTRGAPFVNHRTVLLRGDWYASTVTLHGEGLFTAAFDPDVAAGTPGFLRWGKPYRTPPADENASNGAYSQFPNDELHLFPVGRR
jgi:hypothetical protein